MVNVCSRNVAELLGPFAIESQMNYPTVSLIRGARIRNSITGQVGFLFYQQSFLDRFFSLALMFMSFDPVLRRNYLFPLVDFA
jgi:hypothetical protein